MIRVLRPPTPPAVLVTDGIPKHQEYCAAYETGERKFEFDDEIYGHKDVKLALVTMHHGKCCFCESFVRHISPGTIDHFRPKAASQQSAGDALIRPGYYWLAYDWENLLFVCQTCNQTYKRNQFPLRNPAVRALCHRDPLAREEPLLVNPSTDEPADYLSYRAEYAFSVGGNLRGDTTIEVFQLNERPDLVERRRERLETVRAHRLIVTLMPGTPEALAAQQSLANAVSDFGEYAAMSRAALQS